MISSNNPDAVAKTSRVLPFTPAEVFDAFADPEKLAKWFGPDGFTNTFESIDFSVGGRWIFVMHGPNGVDYKNENVFTEIVKDEKVAFEHIFDPHFVLTVTLAAVDGGTLLTWEQEFETAELAEKVMAIVGPANEQNLDRMTNVLASA